MQTWKAFFIWYTRPSKVNVTWCDWSLSETHRQGCLSTSKTLTAFCVVKPKEFMIKWMFSRLLWKHPMCYNSASYREPLYIYENYCTSGKAFHVYLGESWPTPPTCHLYSRHAISFQKAVHCPVATCLICLTAFWKEMVALPSSPAELIMWQHYHVAIFLAQAIHVLVCDKWLVLLVLSVNESVVVSTINLKNHGEMWEIER